MWGGVGCNVSHKYTVSKSKIVLFQTVQFSISTHFQYQKTVLFQVIQCSISTQVSSIWRIDRTLSGATTLGQSGPGRDGNDNLHSPKLQHNWNLNIRLICVISRTLVEVSLTPLQRRMVYSTAPADWATKYSEACFFHRRFDTVSFLSPGAAGFSGWRVYSTDRRLRLTDHWSRKTSIIIYFLDAHIYFPSSAIHVIHFRCSLFTLKRSCILFTKSSDRRPICNTI